MSFLNGMHFFLELGNIEMYLKKLFYTIYDFYFRFNKVIFGTCKSLFVTLLHVKCTFTLILYQKYSHATEMFWTGTNADMEWFTTEIFKKKFNVSDKIRAILVMKNDLTLELRKFMYYSCLEILFFSIFFLSCVFQVIVLSMSMPLRLLTVTVFSPSIN